MSESAEQLLARAIIVNEIENNLDFAYKFTDPDGKRTGKSGYSYGRCQFDLFNNRTATKCLKECGFTPGELSRLRAQDGAIDDLNAKLRAHSGIVDRYDFEEITQTIEWVREIAAHRGFSFADTEAFIHACDYHNQFGMSMAGPKAKAANRFTALGHPVTAHDVKVYKLLTSWGKKRPDDVERRYANIVKIMRLYGGCSKPVAAGACT